MIQRMLTLLYFMRFLFDRLTGRSHMQETILLRRPLPKVRTPEAPKAGTTMILKIRLNGKTRMIVLPVA